MPTRISFGTDSHLELDLGHARMVLGPAPPKQQTDTGMPSLEGALREALNRPLDFPSLAQAAYPGDRVTIALAPALPQVATVVSMVVETLLTNGVSAGDITLLQSVGGPYGTPRDPRCELDALLREQLPWVTHDPEEKNQLAFLGYSLEGQPEPQPVYLNRALLDADVVISISCTRAGVSEEEQIETGGLFPQFSDLEARQRIRAQVGAGDGTRARQRAGHLVQDAHRQLGAVFQLCLLPGRSGQVARVFAGDARAAQAAGQIAAEQLWCSPVLERCGLVVAAIDEPASAGGWYFVGRALAAAGRMVASGGAIAVCCDLRSALGPALRSIKGAENPHQALRRWERKPPDDWHVARQLAVALEQSRVYLLSQMEESTVEELGMAYVANGAEINRLARQYDSCCVLPCAQHAWPTQADT